MTNDDPVLSDYFAASYWQGRQAFLASCERARLGVESHVHPSLKGPDGEDLTMDSVWIGAETAPRVLVFSCGTHGLEAAAGSATMRRWLDMGGRRHAAGRRCRPAGACGQSFRLGVGPARQ